MNDQIQELPEQEATTEGMPEPLGESLPTTDLTEALIPSLELATAPETITASPELISEVADGNN